ncbi:MAG: 2OG-Fe(II) oxygenase family protein [Pseudomonadota bacterium]
MNVLKVDLQASNAAELFTRSLHETGFGVLVNHGIPDKMVQNVYREWKKFFDSERKNDFLYDPKEQDGYFPIGQETAKGEKIADIKEFYHVYPGKRIPDELREVTFELRTCLYDLAKELLVMVQSQLPESVTVNFDRSLKEMVSNKRTLFRILHYPPLKGSETPDATRAKPHEDINLITLLPAASKNGLQVKDTQGRWHEVPCDFGSISVNTGDMIDMVTRGYLPATTHQVTNPEGEAARQERMSIPLFLHPKADVILKPGFTADDFLTQRLKEIGLMG